MEEGQLGTKSYRTLGKLLKFPELCVSQDNFSAIFAQGLGHGVLNK